jgi:hypothetical protein
MAIFIQGDYGEIERELERLDNALDGSAERRLDAALETAFTATQQVVHIDTGSLRISGRAESSMRGDEWEGTITYGGVAPGAVNDPVEYAGYERDRGGSHDFLRTLPMYDDLFEAAVRDAL